MKSTLSTSSQQAAFMEAMSTGQSVVLVSRQYGSLSILVTIGFWGKWPIPYFGLKMRRISGKVVEFSLL